MKARMARNLGFLALFLIASICEAAIFRPISHSHRSAALEIFKPIDGSFKSLEDAYEALRTFEILGIGKDLDTSTSTCALITETLKSSSASLKDLSVALKSNRVLKCKIDGENFKAVNSKLQAAITKANSLLDFYYSVGSLVLLKDQAADLEIQLENADQIFRSVKALGQSDGRWRYSSNKPESSTRAAGIALETLAGVVSLASADIDQSLIGTLKNDIVKLFDSVEKYDDGAMFFDEKVVDALEYQGPLSTTSSVVRGLVAFADVTSGKITVSGDKILGLAKYFLGIGVPGNSHDFFEQIDALALLENNRVSIPLILSLPSTVLSYSRNDQLKVKVNTVLGSEAPALTVKIVQAASVNSKSAPVIENQDLKYAADGGFHVLDSLPKDIDVGKYEFVFKIALNDPSQSDIYATGGRTWVKIYFTGEIKVENAEISVLDNDLGNVESQKKLDLSTDSAISLSANHLQKLRLSFQLSSPLGNTFKPHQALLKLRHETNVEHVFVVGSSGKTFEFTLDFLGLVDKLYYLSGKYDLQLTVGDAVMENSFFRYLGHIDLDLPEAPEKATRPPLQPIDPLSRFGPKEEIAHIFRAPETRPPKELSLVFLGLTLVPLVGFFIGLLRLGVNFKKFPTATVSAAFAALFHVGIAAVLCLYVLFWLKLNLFTTLKYLSFLGVFLLFVGHRTLSNLAKVKAD
ncbi:dolichyl-diphosphooligosaccharide--protein glycosyltransferase subunit 2-like [Chenopodium quinoa]|uniref:Dolichyl-diphosphooligosaccharide--protein glycosyltransferase subunit 2 n=1 Tax=Chenopodium quinoa TaxID=63459 RepID=A0A803LIG9_CHEQI|nr:dolichyl-diphosphooligosaccharide--protein glycosyltransferase subunit 2-like [Chenopodium quinoa]